MSLFITSYLVAGILSWISIGIYAKRKFYWMITWKEYFQYLKKNSDSPSKEILKWIIFAVIWPIEIAAAVYKIVYSYRMEKEMVKNFPKLDEEELL